MRVSLPKIGTLKYSLLNYELFIYLKQYANRWTFIGGWQFIVATD